MNNKKTGLLLGEEVDGEHSGAMLVPNVVERQHLHRRRPVCTAVRRGCCIERQRRRRCVSDHHLLHRVVSQDEDVLSGDPG